MSTPMATTTMATEIRPTEMFFYGGGEVAWWGDIELLLFRDNRSGDWVCKIRSPSVGSALIQYPLNTLRSRASTRWVALNDFKWKHTEAVVTARLRGEI